MKGNIVILDKIQFIYWKSMCSILYLDECFQVFALFDADGGGTIGPDELECAMTALGFQNYGGGRSLAGSPAFAASVNLYLNISAENDRKRCNQYSFQKSILFPLISVLDEVKAGAKVN